MNLNKKNFVFSSVGDNTNFDDLWIGNNMDYDIYIIYYGNNYNTFNRYKSKVTFIQRRKGSKWQNFKYFYDNNPNIIKNYDKFFILDDDLIFNVQDINNTFKIARYYNLDICSPSYSKNGKISHFVTKHKPNRILTYTNFVENTSPLFSTNALQKFMEKYEYKLIAWGIDYLYITCNGIKKKNSYAIIHAIICENPHDNKKKSKKRELYNISKIDSERIIWLEFAKKYNIPNKFSLTNYKSITYNDIDIPNDLF